MSSQTRWKLLAVLIVASALLSAVGWQQLTLRPRSPTTITITPTVTTVTGSQTIVTATSNLGSFKVLGTIFLDYNGNGKQEKNEPPIPSVTIALDSTNLTVTDSAGGYVIDSVAKGYYQMRVFAPKSYRYMCESASEFRSTKEYYGISVANDTRKDIGLMEGFLTLPLTAKTKYSIGRLYDWDPSTQTYLWWNGKSGSVEEIVDVNHSGIDYDIPVGEDVVAMAPGKVAGLEYGPQGQRGVTIIHMNGELATYYTHLSLITVKIGQNVSRGEKIGESGMSGAAYPHLHINNYRIVGGFQQIYDFYAPTFPAVGRLNGYWEREVTRVSDAPFYWKEVEPSKDNSNLLGFWTVRNSPQFCA